MQHNANKSFESSTFLPYLKVKSNFTRIVQECYCSVLRPARGTLVHVYLSVSEFNKTV